MKRISLLLVAIMIAVPASASPSVTLKCAPNEERVWVYSSLVTWDVSARLKCGTQVEVLGVEKGYVRVRTMDGDEGYVTAEAVPAMEPAPSVAGVPASPAMSAAGSARANMQAINDQKEAAPQLAQVLSTRVGPQPAPHPRVVSEEPVPTPPPNVQSPAAPAPAPATSPAEQSKPAPAQQPDPSQAPDPAHNAPETTPVQTSAIFRQPGMTVRAEPTAKFITITRRSASASTRVPEYSDDDENLPDADSVIAEDLSACSVYFSAYGVTPMQYKWIAAERSKEFPAVCPAPEPSMVDYVVIFTHDLDSFATTLPEPIHTESNGFSDWTPVTSADDTQIPASELDKAHREYAWVFRVHRGTFDPAKFTPRRRPQYTKAVASSHASSKSIEDAMQFIAEHSATQ